MQNLCEDNKLDCDEESSLHYEIANLLVFATQLTLLEVVERKEITAAAWYRIGISCKRI